MVLATSEAAWVNRPVLFGARSTIKLVSLVELSCHRTVTLRDAAVAVRFEGAGMTFGSGGGGGGVVGARTMAVTEVEAVFPALSVTVSVTG